MLTFGRWNAILTKSVGDTDKKPTDKTLMWGLSSAGRASALQAEGHRFEPYWSHQIKRIWMDSRVAKGDRL